MRVGLVVRGFCLDLPEVDVGGVEELVLVDGVVLGCGPGEPDGPVEGFEKEAAAGVDCDLGEGRVVDVVVGGPEPVVFEVEARGGGGDLEGHVGCDAVFC